MPRSIFLPVPLSRPELDAPLRDAIVSLPDDARRLVLAVSGGGDSMALLHAMARWAPERVAIVATFDHGTGEYARDASDLVAAEARLLGLPVVRERAIRPGRTEAEWREARWSFLRRVGAAHRARVATAHTADDQLETIVQRWMRGAGARGLAALAAKGPVVRPWIRVHRAQLDAWRTHEGIESLADPANSDRRHQRVRVRLDILPAYAVADPGFAAAMLELGERAAELRAEVDRFVRQLPFKRVSRDVWSLERSAVEGWSPDQLGVVWPALLATLNVSLTGEGTRRLIRFTIGKARAGTLELPDGVLVVRHGPVFEVRVGDAVRVVKSARAQSPRALVAGSSMEWPGWRFERLKSPPGEGERESSPDVAAFQSAARLEVRQWEPGDRIRTAGAPAGRRISRYLAEMGVPRLDRRGWPVVLLDGDVVWVPGVCRGLSAPHRSGRSDLIWYRSDREFS